MTRPEVWSIDEVARLDRRTTLLWCTDSVRAAARARFGFAEWRPPATLPQGTQSLVAIGGGTLLDEAKAFVHDAAAPPTLVAVPSIWGSGAEASPVVVLNRDGRKVIRVDDGYLPSARAIWPELAATIPGGRVRAACGDVWAHAVEGFLSPLATEELRQEIADLIRGLLDLPLAYDLRWFELGARAAAAQARSSVGLVHGIAHTLEPALNDPAWGHARLCATLLAPVLRFDLRVPQTAERLRSHRLDPASLESAAGTLFDRDGYAELLPALSDQWPIVIRDRSTRTNCALVRAADLGFFLEYS